MEIDRVVANPLWSGIFNDYWLEGFVARSSNLKPLRMWFSGKCTESRNKGRLFRYEASWDLEEECGNIVRDNWFSNATIYDPMGRVQRLLSKCRKALNRWS